MKFASTIIIGLFAMNSAQAQVQTGTSRLNADEAAAAILAKKLNPRQAQAALEKLEKEVMELEDKIRQRHGDPEKYKAALARARADQDKIQSALDEIKLEGGEPSGTASSTSPSAATSGLAK